MRRVVSGYSLQIHSVPGNRGSQPTAVKNLGCRGRRIDILRVLLLFARVPQAQGWKGSGGTTKKCPNPIQVADWRAWEKFDAQGVQLSQTMGKDGNDDAAGAGAAER